MDREDNLPTQPDFSPKLIRPINPSSSSSSSSSSSPEFLRHVQAAFKRHRPLALGVSHSNSLKPRRVFVPQRQVSKTSSLSMCQVVETDKSREDLSMSQEYARSESMNQLNNFGSVAKKTEESIITPPSISGTIAKAIDDKLNQFEQQKDGTKPYTGCMENNLESLVQVGSQHVDGAGDLMATRLENLSSHMSSLALTEMDWNANNQVEAPTVNHELNSQNNQNAESDITFKSDGGISSLLTKRTTTVQDKLQQCRNFISHPSTQSSVVGPSYATTSVYSTSASSLKSTAYSSCLCSSSRVVEPIGDFDVIRPSVAQENVVQSSTSLKDTSGVLKSQIAVAPQSFSTVDTQMESNKFPQSREQHGCVPQETGILRNTSLLDDRLSEGNIFVGNVTDVRSEAPLSKSLSSDVKPGPCNSNKHDKVASGKGATALRRRNYDPDLYFKINGKFYQRLGKIGSGGSSEVHKVISSDCTIYALKKIKLKGRDYATAFGFCQEIEYLTRLKGKHNIIQLVDYEVTDKALLQEVTSGSISNKDGRVKDDGYIYMVLEYGEIDLAHMLSQKWKQIDNSNQSIDDNWLRFYWQQILLAVNTIHEERIVHSDLKPANFLLVKGSLKLIDFGIAKAIMSDTTNIQRDSQVGTLSYMSPEAFLCNENDENGNTIKCGRPSDIWSLGCILYQMVYGRTPFADYKTFWAKFKVITDPNHQIVYEPVSNPWLLDIMKKCLAWDRNKRWRIPQLLQHPFIVPHISPQLSSSQVQNCMLLHLIAENCTDNPEASKLCSQLQELLRDPFSIAFQLPTCRKHQRSLLSQMSKLCLQLEEHLANAKSNSC